MEAVLRGPAGITRIEAAVFTIGSSPDNQLVLNDVKVSAYHAEIRQEGQGYTITDLGSTHGVYVNEQRLDWNTAHQLTPGNTITIGDTTFIFDEQSGRDKSGPYGASEQGGRDKSGPYDASENQAPTVENTPPAHSVYGAGIPVPPLPAGMNPGYAAPQSYMSSAPFQQPVYMPQYQQQAYIPPGYAGPVPGSVPPAQRANRRILWIVVSLLLVIGVVGGAAYVFFTRSTPEKTIDAYCNALVGRDYQNAYNQLSSSLQKIVVESQFEGNAKEQGIITSCAHGSATITGNDATANLTEVSSGQTFSGSIALAQENTTWRINTLLTSPALTLTRFCNALQNGDYPTAYNQLSSTYQQAHTEAAFAQSFQGLTCTFSSVSISGITGTADVSFIDQSGQITPVSVALSQDLDPKSNGDWKINGR